MARSVSPASPSRAGHCAARGGTAACSPSALGVLALAATFFAMHTAALRREALARSDLEAGIRSATAGEFAAAAAQFARAIDRASAGGSQALRQLAVEAEHRRQNATRGRAARDRARLSSSKGRADPLSPDYGICAQVRIERAPRRVRRVPVSSVPTPGPTTPSSTGSTRPGARG